MVLVASLHVGSLRLTHLAQDERREVGDRLLAEVARLSPGDVVVRSGQRRLVDGERVVPRLPDGRPVDTRRAVRVDPINCRIPGARRVPKTKGISKA